MNKLDAALAWAARGFKVFPLQPNSKKPIHDAWYDVATSDPDQIRALWTMPVIGGIYDYNIGCDTTGFVVADVDVKAGKDGHNQYVQLGGSYDTLVVKTTTGGYHCYFEGPDSANVNIARDVEIRSHHGYVVAPGSTIDGIPYEVITDRDVEWVPLTIDKLLRPVYARGETLRFADDNPANIQMAIDFLTSCPPAVEGMRGDETTFITAARLVREMALSSGKAYELLCDYYNPRCTPPWPLDELMAKVENAQAYATAEMGRIDPVQVFAAVPEIEPPPSLHEQIGVTWGNALMPSATRARPWVIDRMLMEEKVSLLIAAGSAGKSTLQLVIAAHGALGLDFGSFKVFRPFNSVIFNGEDDVEEMSRRLQAICSAYNFDYQTVRQHILLLSYEELDVKLVTPQGRNPVRNDPLIDYLAQLTEDPSVGMLALDPLVDIHNCDEGDSVHMNAVMKVLQDLAKRSKVAVLISHHSTKGGSDRQEDRVGNMDISRGSSSIVFKCRAAFTLMDASNKDCEEYNIQTQERHAYVRLDDAKMNNTLRSPNPVWFKRMGVHIQSNDVVGVLHRVELNKDKAVLRLRLAEILIGTVQANGAGSLSIMQAVALLKSQEPIMANKKDTEIKTILMQMFSTEVDVRGNIIHIVRENGDKGNYLVTVK